MNQQSIECFGGWHGLGKDEGPLVSPSSSSYTPLLISTTACHAQYCAQLTMMLAHRPSCLASTLARTGQETEDTKETIRVGI